VIPVALAAAALALPQQALVAPGVSFAGLRLGATAAQIEAAWGTRHGRCQGCTRPTWYFTYRPFEPTGAAVSFQNGRAASYFTVWSPGGWHTKRGLTIGDPASRIVRLYGVLRRTDCGSYSALVLRRGRTETQFYVYRGEVWGFGLSWAGAPPCR
jgi:hypothetical protein